MQYPTINSLSGFGLGLRAEHYQDILNTNPNIDWLEIISENYMALGGRAKYFLQQIIERYPVVMHGVSMSIGTTDKIDYEYLAQLKALAKEVNPCWISDHLCFTGVNNLNMHDLLPLPYTEEAINHVANRIKQIQDYLGQQILIENVSSYLTYKESQIPEWEFISSIAETADCFILLDVNNIYVSSFNHKFNPLDYIYGIPTQRVKQIHVAGHSNQGDYIIDTHDTAIIPEVWSLYEKTLAHIGFIPTMIERDDNTPPLSELIQELNHARKIAQPFLTGK